MHESIFTLPTSYGVVMMRLFVSRLQAYLPYSPWVRDFQEVPYYSRPLASNEENGLLNIMFIINIVWVNSEICLITVCICMSTGNYL